MTASSSDLALTVKRMPSRLCEKKRVGGKLDGRAHRVERPAGAAIGEAAEKHGHGADFRITERSDNVLQIVRVNSDVAVADDEQVVLGFSNESAKLVYLIARTERLRSDQEPDVAIGEIVLNPGDDRHGGIVGVIHAEKRSRIGTFMCAEFKRKEARLNGARSLAEE